MKKGNPGARRARHGSPVILEANHLAPAGHPCAQQHQIAAVREAQHTGQIAGGLVTIAEVRRQPLRRQCRGATRGDDHGTALFHPSTRPMPGCCSRASTRSG